MAELTRIRGSQIMPAADGEGLDDSHIKSGANISKTKIAGLVSDLSSITTSISAEETARILAGTNLQNSLNTTTLALNTEVLRATAAEVVLTADLTAEVARATAAESSIITSVTSESTRASIAENVISTDLSTEVSRATTAEGVLTSAIATLSGSSSTGLADEITRATTAEGVLTSGLSTEVARATVAEGVLTSGLSTEVARATTAEGVLTNDLATEVTRATAAEVILTNNLLSEIGRAITAEDSLSIQLAGEEASRIANFSSLTSALNTESQDRTAADIALTESVNEILATKADLAGSAIQSFAVAAPTQASHATNKAYVDGLAMGLDIKGSVRLATVGEIDLAFFPVGSTIDGIIVGEGDRVLVKNQPDAKFNGIYNYILSSEHFIRADDSNNNPGAEVTAGMFTFVEEGSINANSGFVLATPNNSAIGGIQCIDIDNTELDFSQFSGAGQVIAGTGLSKNGNTVSITNTGIAPGTYTKVVVNAQGQIITASTPTTREGYGLENEAAYIGGSVIQAFLVADGVGSNDAVNLSQLTAEVTRATAAESSLQNNINTSVTALNSSDATEVSRATAAEAVLTSSISTESTRAITAEGILTSGLSAEVSRATAAESVLTSDLTAEVSRATTAEVVLQNALNTEEASRISGDNLLTSNLTAEVSRATAAEVVLTNDLGTEVTRAKAAEVAIAANLVTESTRATTAEGVITSDLSTEVSRATAAESALQTAITTLSGSSSTGLSDEISRATTAEGVITSNLITETFRATAAEVVLTNDLATEVTRAKAAEGVITSNLAAEVTRATTAENTIINDVVDVRSSIGIADGDINLGTFATSNYITDGQTVKVAVEAIDANVFSAIAAETATRITEDIQLGTTITAVATNLATNYYNITQVDSRFADLVAAAPAALDTLGEIAAQLAVDGSVSAALTTAISNEVVRATGIESGLQLSVDTITSNLSTEVARATAAEGVITSNLAAEVTRATAAEGVITSGLSTEVTNRTNAIAALSGSNGVERVGNDFHAKVVPFGGIVTGVNGIELDTNVMTTQKSKMRDPFTGVIDGINNTFTSSTQIVNNSEMVFINGLLQNPTDDYVVIDGNSFVFVTAPQALDKLVINFVAA